MLGAILVEYLVGKEGLPEYDLYIKRGSDITKRLGPFLDDVVMALVWGTMSKLCAELPKRSEN
jgi:hypothetical protein